MDGTASPLFILAAACQAQADNLQTIANNMNYQGPQINSLTTNEMALRVKATLLRTSAVSDALAANSTAQDKLKSATDVANRAASQISEVMSAITVAGLILSLAASAITGDIPSILTSADALVNGVTPLL